MAARPPPNDIDDEPDTGEFGIVALDGAIDRWDVSFPVTSDELSHKYGNQDIPVDPAGHEIEFGEALAECPSETFERKQELLNALHPVFEDKRERLSNSILGRLRAMVPF
jgi:hypothetical protein